MGNSNVWNSRPTTCSRTCTCRVCGNSHGLIRKYGLMCCRQCFHSNAKEIGFIKVHALQRMGGRFENLSGHERSCVMSGQHQTGHCTCCLNHQDPNDGANGRGSISRIVLSVEALVEVLEEIHQQSIVSSSRPALSSIGSVPATVVAICLPLNSSIKKQPSNR